MLKSAPLKVQLVGHTVFTPPIKEEGDGNVDLVFWPDESNELDVGLEHAPNIFGAVARENWENHGTLT